MGAVQHREIPVDGVRTFYRESGPPDAPVLLLPHGYPCSSYEFRALLPALADRCHCLAPDYPGFGYSDTPAAFRYDFEGYARWLGAFADALGIDRYVLYMHDYGTWIALRLAMAAPARVRGLIIQNGDIYEDTMGPKYEALKAYWRSPSEEARQLLVEAVTERGYRDEFVGEVEPALIARIPPDLWHLHWSLTTVARREIMVRLMEALKENVGWFPRYQQYLRENQPPALILWGPQDGYMPEPSARAYLRDLPNAELHLFAGGHWLLETHLEQVAPLIRGFLARL